tara:strand:- start:532 stop:1242 length:711 start_codon:yes stop_codon:yes gene_type:complete
MSKEEVSDLMGKNSFINHVFNFSEEGKGELLNIAQYSLMGVVPIVLLNKLVQRFIPEVDNDKGTPEILAELVFQILAMFFGIVLINRMITYVPTYSGVKYEEINLTTIVLAFLMIVLSLQTKLGEKVNILVSRVMDLVDGSEKKKETPRKNNNQNNQQPQHQPSQADNLSASALGILPQGPPGLPNSLSTNTGNQVVQPQQPTQNMQQMNQQQMPMMNEPMAANEMGGGAFSNIFG